MQTSHTSAALTPRAVTRIGARTERAGPMKSALSLIVTISLVGASPPAAAQDGDCGPLHQGIAREAAQAAAEPNTAAVPPPTTGAPLVEGQDVIANSFDLLARHWSIPKRTSPCRRAEMPDL